MHKKHNVFVMNSCEVEAKVKNNNRLTTDAFSNAFSNNI